MSVALDVSICDNMSLQVTRQLQALDDSSVAYHGLDKSSIDRLRVEADNMHFWHSDFGKLVKSTLEEILYKGDWIAMKEQ